MSYVVGDVARISTTTVFTDIDGAAFDPTKVVVKYTPPGAATVELTHGEEAALVKDGVGDYHVDVQLTVAGEWVYRIEGYDGSDNFMGADEGVLTVDKSRI